MVCERPKCYRTKSDKCVNPNSWILFLQKNGGKGLTRSELTTKYYAWKSTRFPSNSTASSRRDLLCDDIASSASNKADKRKRTTSSQSDEDKAAKRKRTTSPQSASKKVVKRKRTTSSQTASKKVVKRKRTTSP